MNTSISTKIDYFDIPTNVTNYTTAYKYQTYTYNNYSTVYQPFMADYVYSTDFSWQVEDTTNGWKNYMFSNCIRNKVVDILLSLYKPYTNNNFERHLYKIVYDLIYDMTVKKSVIFSNFFKYDKEDIQKYIKLIIEDYHSRFKEDV